MSDSPSDGRCTKFADYLTENYVTNDSRFPPKLWAENHQQTSAPQMALNRFIVIIVSSFIPLIQPYLFS
jgi:hypothetical protein